MIPPSGGAPDRHDRGPDDPTRDAPEAPLASGVPVAADDPLAPFFTVARAYFVQGQPARARGSVLLFVTLLFFVFSMGSGATPESVAILVGVLIVHELGHYLGMRAFGYRDVRMFFVPFLGAAVSGRRGSVAAWKDGVVLLLGPVPGVLLGALALLATVRWPMPPLVHLGETLLLVNAFNLLPLGGLDGGKLLLRVVFARHRYLELAFSALGALGLALVALGLRSFALGLFALIGLASLGRRARVLEAAATLRSALTGETAAALDDARARRLFDETRAALGPPLANDPRAVGSAMEDVLLAAQPAPGWLASIGLVGVWAGTCVVAFVAGIVLAHALAPADWQQHTFPTYSVELPDDPIEGDESWTTPVGPRTAHVVSTSLGIVNRFSVVEIDAGTDVADADRTAWSTMARAHLEQDLGVRGATRVSESEVVVAGRAASESTWSNGWRRWRARSVVVGSRVYVLIVSSPEGTTDEARFLDSFVLL